MAGDFDSTLPIAIVFNMLTIKLPSTNYLLWSKKTLPLLSYQNLSGYVDGLIPKPSPPIVTGGNIAPNHA